MGCSPLDMPHCWHVGGLRKWYTFYLPDRECYWSFFVGIPFVSFHKIAESVLQQIRNCPYKTQTAITGTRPPLVAS